MLFIADAMRDSPNNPVVGPLAYLDGGYPRCQRQGCVVLVVDRARHANRPGCPPPLFPLTLVRANLASAMEKSIWSTTRFRVRSLMPQVTPKNCLAVSSVKRPSSAA